VVLKSLASPKIAFLVGFPWIYLLGGGGEVFKIDENFYKLLDRD